MTFTHEQRAVIAEAARLRREARKAATKARPKSPKADRGRERDGGFLAYLRRQRCEAAGRGIGDCLGPIDPAHIRYNDGSDRQNPGGARKNHDRHCNPLCRAHHDKQHAGSERAFWDCLGKDAYETAAAHYAAYQGQAASGEAGLDGYGGSRSGPECTQNKRTRPHDRS